MAEEYSFRSWFEQQLVHLQDNALFIIQQGEEHIPMFVIYGSGPNQVAAVPLFELPTDAKDAAFALHKIMSEAPGVHAVVMVTEAWTVSRDARKGESVDPEKSLEFEPDRKEAMMWNCLSHGQQLIALREIDKEHNTWGSELILTDPKEAMMSGRMVDDGEDNATRH